MLAVVVGLVALAAAEHYSGTADPVEGLVIGRRLPDTRENPSASYRLRLRLPDGASAEVEVPEETEYREGARALLTRVRGGLFGTSTYRFDGYM